MHAAPLPEQAHREAEEMLANARQQSRALLAGAAAQQQQSAAAAQQAQRGSGGPFRGMPSGGLSVCTPFPPSVSVPVCTVRQKDQIIQ
jgi:hypothetical protein